MRPVTPEYLRRTAAELDRQRRFGWFPFGKRFYMAVALRMVADWMERGAP